MMPRRLISFDPEANYHLYNRGVNRQEISRAMMKISVSYTKTINIYYDRVGPLFQGAFQAKQVDSNRYLRDLIGYIHLNPIASELVERPEDWMYSSFHDYQNLDLHEVKRIDTLIGDGSVIDLGGHLGGLDKTRI